VRRRCHREIDHGDRRGAAAHVFFQECQGIDALDHRHDLVSRRRIVARRQGGCMGARRTASAKREQGQHDAPDRREKAMRLNSRD
jgi:hypothetical protein